MREVADRRSLRAELGKEGLITLDGLRWRDGYAWCEFQPTSDRGSDALCLRYLWATQCGKGFGTSLLRKVLRAVDRCGIDLYLEAEPFTKASDGQGWAPNQIREGGLGHSQLRAWYRRYGFTSLEHNRMVRRAAPDGPLPPN
jgi:GNAT superfamily N-acetyltransferase